MENIKKVITKNIINKHFIWNTIGLTLYGFVSLFLLIIVKYINGLNEAGIFSYGYSICTLFFYISLFYSRTYQIANYNDNKIFNQFLTFRILSSIISLIIILVFSIISHFNKYKIIIIILLMLFRIIDAISDTFYGYLQNKNKLYKVGISYTLKSFFGIVIFFVIDYISKNLLISTISLVIVNLTFLLIYDIRNYKKIKNETFKFDFSNIKLIFKESLPIFIFSFMSIYLANAEKYILVYFVSNEMQSIFAILIMPATVLSLVGSYIITPFIKRLKELNQDKKYKEFNKLTSNIILSLFIIGICGTIFCYYFGIPILNLIYSINLNAYCKELCIIIIASIMCAGSMVLSNIFTILNKNKIQIAIYSCCCVIVTIICPYLIRQNYISGAVNAYLISYACCFTIYIFKYYTLIRKLKGDKNVKKRERLN